MKKEEAQRFADDWNEDLEKMEVRVSTSVLPIEKYESLICVKLGSGSGKSESECRVLNVYCV